MRTVNRRAVTAILVLGLALWGLGLPRFAHLMTAHVPGKESAAASCTRCCSQCSLRAVAESEPAPAAHTTEEEPRDSSGSNGLHDCSVCDLLATLVSTVPPFVATSVAWQPVVECAIDTPARIALRIEFDPHAPRGPPAA